MSGSKKKPPHTLTRLNLLQEITLDVDDQIQISVEKLITYSNKIYMNQYIYLYTINPKKKLSFNIIQKLINRLNIYQ